MFKLAEFDDWVDREQASEFRSFFARETTALREPRQEIDDRSLCELGTFPW